MCTHFVKITRPYMQNVCTFLCICYASKKGCSSPSTQPLSREILKCCGCKIQPPPKLMTTLCVSHKGAAYTVSTVPRVKFAPIQSPHCWLPHACPHLWQKISHWELEAEASGSQEATSMLLEKLTKQTYLLTRTSSRKEGSRSYLCIQHFADSGSKYFSSS